MNSSYPTGPDAAHVDGSAPVVAHADLRSEGPVTRMEIIIEKLGMVFQIWTNRGSTRDPLKAALDMWHRVRGEGVKRRLLEQIRL